MGQLDFNNFMTFTNYSTLVSVNPDSSHLTDYRLYEKKVRHADLPVGAEITCLATAINDSNLFLIDRSDGSVQIHRWANNLFTLYDIGIQAEVKVIQIIAAHRWITCS